MAETLFDRAFEHLIGVEGGYVNDPRDPGGETKYGISKRAYPDLDIASLTLDDAKGIYRRDYWEALKCDDLPAAIAVGTFDCGVNQGTGRAARILQQSLGVAADGIIGPQTLAAAKDADAGSAAADMLARRAIHYSGLPTFGRFGRGWMNRLFSVHAFVLKEL